MKNKNKKGFTLIELLAVIVILAIIALIATPIVLNIISESKESATLQSAQFYMDAVENAVAQKMMDEPAFRPKTCNIQSDGNLKCGDIEVEVEIKGEKPTSGTITLETGKITGVTLELGDKTITKNSDGKLVYGEATPKEKTLDDICDYDETSGVTEKTAGARYSCEVKENTLYTFYVLTTPSEGDTRINLIMERNICEDGSLADESQTCLVSWQESGQITDGPVTAMDYLYNATKDWKNISNVEMDYTNEGSGYEAIITANGITKIIKSDGTPATVLTDQEGYSNLKARMPYHSEISAYDMATGANAYLYDYLSSPRGGMYSHKITGITGYWLLKSFQSLLPSANYISDGNFVGTGVSNSSVAGVRPVITLKI